MPLQGLEEFIRMDASTVMANVNVPSLVIDPSANDVNFFPGDPQRLRDLSVTVLNTMAQTDAFGSTKWVWQR